MPIPENSQEEDLVFFMIKQEFFDTKKEFEYACDYYNKILMFSQSPVQKAKVIRYEECWPFEGKGTYEINTLCHYGDNKSILIEEI